MHEKFEVALSREEYVVGLDALVGELAKLDPGRNRRIFERLAAVVVLLLATSWFFPETTKGLLIFIVGYAVVEAVLASRWTQLVHGVSYDPSVFPQVFEFSDEGIRETGPARTRQWQWAAVRRLHERDAALVFELVGWDMIVLPSRLWTSPEERQRFLDEIASRVAEPVSSSRAPSAMKLDQFTLAATGAFVDVCLVISLLLPVHSRRYGPLAQELGFAAAMLLVLLVGGLAGYAAYRITKAGLPRLDARSPAAATAVGQVLIWAGPAWLAASALGLI